MKICCKCKKKQSIENFSIKTYRSGNKGWQAWCKNCHKGYKDSHYQEHSEEYIAKAKINRRKSKIENFTKLREYFKTHPCVDCGETDPVVLQSDHVRGEKRINISLMVCHGCSWDAILIELQKCDTRCANCHIRKTAKDFNWYNCFN